MICWSERWRPNQVFHQKRNGMRTMSHPVTKKRIFWLRGIERLGFGAEDGGLEDSGSAAIRKQGTIAEVAFPAVSKSSYRRDG